MSTPEATCAPRLHVHALPSHVPADALAGSTVVVIDLLRATTTICRALAAGATDVVPLLEIDDVRRAVAGLDRRQLVLGGERHGKKIPGFDLGNSPAEYTPESVGGRRVLITTTNGTRALDHARQANRVVVGSLLNLSAVVVASIRHEARIDILCAGTDGRETGEDLLAAGGFVDRLGHLPGVDRALNDAAAMAGSRWSLVKAKARASGRSLEDEIVRALRDTAGGHNLIEIGLEQDLVDAARIDQLDIVPELDVSQWRITAQNVSR